MLKRCLCFAAAALLLLAVFPAAGQADWSAFMFNGVTQQLMRVRLDGSTTTYDLDIFDGSFIGAQSMDFSADGSRIAYCVPLNETNGSRLSFFVKDIDSTVEPYTIELGKGDGCWVTYSDDSTQIAVGVVHYYAGDPNADTSVPPWQLLVFDASNAQLLYEMNAEKAAPAGFDQSPSTYMPDVRYFNNGRLIFAVIPWGTDASALSPAYLWQFADDSIQAVDRWWRPGITSLAQSGELVWLELDGSLPAADPGGPLPQANVVKVADKSGQEQVIYANPDWVLTNTAFIDDGTQLAIGELQAAGANATPGNQLTHWVALDRDGTITELASILGFSQIASAPNGFVLLSASDNGMSPLVKLDYHNGDAVTTLWQEQATSGIVWSLVWTAETTAAQDMLTPFQPVTP